MVGRQALNLEMLVRFHPLHPLLYITDAHGDINFAKGVVFQAETTMATFLPEIGTFFTQAITWMGDVLDVVVENPALLVLVIAMPVCGFAVGLLNRLIRM